MTDESVMTTGRNGKGSDGDILGRQLIFGVESTQRFMEGLSARLCFILDGLRNENPNIDGAIGFISDLEDDVHSRAEDLIDVAEKAKRMVAMAHARNQLGNKAKPLIGEGKKGGPPIRLADRAPQ